jgi:hypothetical protein
MRMAERPVFVPKLSGQQLVQEVAVSFLWHPGMAPSQKKKNVAELHQSAALSGLAPLLEISSKSEREAGRKLSAFYQTVSTGGREITVECAFQGSKVFEHGGPYTGIYDLSSRDAKRDERLRTSGRLIGFSFEGKDFPLSPPTVFYDWLYVNALYPYRDWLERLDQFAGFTDIEFNPERSLNCQARSCALFVALQRRGQLERAIVSFDAFIQVAAVATL